MSVLQESLEKVFVNQLQDKQNVLSTFLAKNKILLKDKKGKHYLSFILSDSSGDIDAKIWDNVDAADSIFDSGDIVSIKGNVQVYQNRKQVIVHKLEKFQGDTELNKYIQRSHQDPGQMLQQLLTIVDKVKDKYVKELLQNTLNDSSLRPLLLNAPAAKSVHHARLGGLLEHILSVCRLAEAVAPLYPKMNQDLLIFGAIFHDIGKIWELRLDQNGIIYTNKGRLIGHLTMAVELIEKKSSQILNFPEELKDICKHIVLSHHGKHEYGSPKLPQTLEAFVVWMLDDMDSKIDSIQAAMQSPGSGDWSQHSSLFDRYFYTKRSSWD